MVKFGNCICGGIWMLFVICIFFGGGIGGVEYYCDFFEVYYVYILGLIVVSLFIL